MNTRCHQCPKARNTFHGKYCTHLSLKVEYAAEPPCEKKQN